MIHIAFNRVFDFTRVLAVFALALFAAGAACAQDAPDALVKSVTQDVLAAIKADPQLQAGNQARVRELIESKLLPHFDFERMTALAMGRNWRQATPEQQKRLTDEFRSLLVRTYSGALNQYRNETVNLKPLRMNPSDTEVIVRTELQKPGGQPVPIDYSMAKGPTGWKAYDVVVGGVSLVTNYRDEFNSTIQASGIDGLIKTLADKNRGGAGK